MTEARFRELIDDFFAGMDFINSYTYSVELEWGTENSWHAEMTLKTCYGRAVNIQLTNNPDDADDDTVALELDDDGGTWELTGEDFWCWMWHLAAGDVKDLTEALAKSAKSADGQSTDIETDAK